MTAFKAMKAGNLQETHSKSMNYKPSEMGKPCRFNEMQQNAEGRDPEINSPAPHPGANSPASS
jgi:hypothetical protein